MSQNAIAKNMQINEELCSSIKTTLKKSSEFLQNSLDNSQILDYEYTPNEAAKELGLEIELINELVEDYIIQTIKSKTQLLKYIQVLQKNKKKSIELDYVPLRELIHKNLGVAKNLRIKDGMKILNELLKKDDLEYLTLCVEVLESCTIRLNPECAYKTLKLIDLKNSLTDYFFKE